MRVSGLSITVWLLHVGDLYDWNTNARITEIVKSSLKHRRCPASYYSNCTWLNTKCVYHCWLLRANCIGLLVYVCLDRPPNWYTMDLLSRICTFETCVQLFIVVIYIYSWLSLWSSGYGRWLLITDWGVMVSSLPTTVLNVKQLADVGV